MRKRKKVHFQFCLCCCWQTNCGYRVKIYVDLSQWQFSGSTVSVSLHLYFPRSSGWFLDVRLRPGLFSLQPSVHLRWAGCCQMDSAVVLRSELSWPSPRWFLVNCALMGGDRAFSTHHQLVQSFNSTVPLFHLLLLLCLPMELSGVDSSHRVSTGFNCSFYKVSPNSAGYLLFLLH